MDHLPGELSLLVLLTRRRLQSMLQRLLSLSQGLRAFQRLAKSKGLALLYQCSRSSQALEDD